MPIGFFTTLAAWIGVGVIEATQRAKADKIARENPIKIKGLGLYDNDEANRLYNFKSPRELKEIFYSEYNEDPPAIKVMLNNLGKIDWECYKNYPLNNVIKHCCVCGISEKRNYKFGDPNRSDCKYCNQFGVGCKWQNNKTMSDFYEKRKKYKYI